MAGVVRSAEPGYTVIMDVKVNAVGVAEDARLVHSDSYDLGQFAPLMARQMKFDPRIEDGKPVASVQRVPLFFPVEGDGGAEAGRAPVPELKMPSQPEYPRELRKSETPGGAIFHLQVDAKGRVKEVSVVRASHPEFGKSGAAALKRWNFVPPKQNGNAIATEFHLAMVFEIEGKRPAWKWYVAPRPAMSAAFVVSGMMVR